MDDFKKKVLDSCQQALKECTDICYTYERGRTGQGGKWISVIFHIQKNKDYTDQLSLAEFIELQPKPGLIIEDENDYSEVLPDPDDATPITERLELLSDACNHEFSQAEMQQLFEVIVTIPPRKLPPDTASDGSLDLRRYHYLAGKYAKMCRYNPMNRLNYLVKMLEEDAADET